MEEESLPAGQLYRLAWVFYLALALGGVAWIGWREQRISLHLFIDVSTFWRDVAVGLAAAGLLLGLWALAARHLPLAKALEERLRSLLGPLAPGQAWGLAVLSGFAEEFFFRGAVQGSFGYLWASLLFALLHTGRESHFYLWTAFAAIAGLLFGALTLWTDNLLSATLAHVAVNAVNLRRLAR